MNSLDQISAKHWEQHEILASNKPTPRLGRVLRSGGAVFAGVLTVVFLSLFTDQVLHMLDVYPPWGQPMWAVSLNLLALAYRTLYNVAGGYVTAQLAPRNPGRHANILGIVGTVMGLAGAIATIPMNFGPAWYPIALVITAFPGCWLGGVLRARASR